MSVRHINLINNNAVPEGYALLGNSDNSSIKMIPVSKLSMPYVLSLLPLVTKVMLHPRDMERLKASLALAQDGVTYGSA